MSESSAEEIARLRARVAALESALERRSQELRTLQQHVCARDLAVIARVTEGLPAVPPGCFDPTFWEETTDLVPADVEDLLAALWRSTTPTRR